jgi:hypothetical protein
MNATETKKKYLSPEEIVARAKAGTGGLIAWTIDACYPEEGQFPSGLSPRVGRCYAWYTLEDESWCRIPHTSAKAAALRDLLQSFGAGVVEWATAYDDPPRDDDEKPFGVGPPGHEKLMAYRGRYYQTDTLMSGDDPFEDGIEGEISDYSTNDVGSVCYYEKKDGVFKMVIG